ncbi:hypothetical protein [Nodosilinea nodulosa]|uniref:hypothetical protein n=1 Tax=Nodosilinea nodulosa TaxID=416001 RepID=UPI0003191DF6|nr:hypothetical protein [Nodosilinea nodulosa]
MLNQFLGRRYVYLSLFTVMVGAVMVGSLATAQTKPAKPIAAISSPGIGSLSLSSSQMQALEEVVAAHRASFEALLTPAQLDQLTALRAEYRNVPIVNLDEDPIARLHLNPAQQEDLTALRAILMAQFEAIFTPQQLQQLVAMGLIVPVEGP